MSLCRSAGRGPADRNSEEFLVVARGNSHREMTLVGTDNPVRVRRIAPEVAGFSTPHRDGNSTFASLDGDITIK